ncbi:molybdate/tungstate transport system substrate-binding protein [Marinitoga hydrogenitolerans DSM 16785]|uniref:Molybdate/tungstate transport system substrate-binding protein n=1 Tax=Marinitoga hydrogenitolerans (strain DSM 16785 / JCM 12826 / AT1271) TaxID=1122195 RepID=A0A1M5A3L3_MARH1|nr:extracellular solute-binding protein [Marinitoga hydrogenitolerans]SHF24883.1 molybdate/tungstate transport system substrate-binding protein [Marinitoga hydrogenitolerans DSM 16785]
MKKVFMLLIIIIIISYTSFSKNLIILHAGSLTNVLKAISIEFEKENPDISVQLMGSGSLVVMRKITELNQLADIAFVADYMIIPQFLYPKFADFNIIFSNNSMVLAYTDKSKYENEINKNNWFNIIFNKNVLFGYSNPDLDPCGYRTLMTMQLAETYYNINDLYEKFLNAKNKFILKKSVDLVSYLEANELDYAFLYKSTAFQHNLKYLEFPEEINLSSIKFKNNYKKAFVNILGKDGKKVRAYGSPINYGFTLLKNAPHKDLALKFIKFMYSDKGKKIFKEKGMSLFAKTDYPEKLPDDLKLLWGY